MTDQTTVAAATPLSDLASLRPGGPYDTTQITTVRVAPGYDGTVVLWEYSPPTGTPLPNGWTPPWFKRMIILAPNAGTIAFRPTDPSVVVIDFKHGFEPTPVNLWPFVRHYLDSHGGPAPGNPPVIT